jgi:hypothetical protein
MGRVGVSGEVVAAAMRGRHRMWLRDPTGRSLVLGLAMSAVGGGKSGWDGGGGRGWRMDF